MDRIGKAQKVLNLIWILLLIGSFLFFLYPVFKKYKEKKRLEQKRKRYLNTRFKQKTDKKTSRNETTLVEYPLYRFSEVSQEEEEKEWLQDDEETEKEIILYNYDDLVHIAKTGDRIFFEDYMKSLQRSLSDKRNIYIDLLQKKTTVKETSDGQASEGPLAMYDETKQHLGKLCHEFTDILEEIDRKLNKITMTQLKNNFRDMIWNKNKGLESMIGNREVKDFIAREIFAFRKDPTSSYTTFQNMLILGDSGMGKDKLSVCKAHAYHMAGITVRSGHSMLSKADLESAFVSATGGKARDLIITGLERCQDWNEIYDLVPDPNSIASMRSSTHGMEVINQLVFLADEYRGLLRITGIGYQKDMLDSFLSSNQGMDRRFPDSRRITLTGYDETELTHILIRHLMGTSNKIRIGKEEAKTLYVLVSATKEKCPHVFKLQAGAMLSIASHIDNIIGSMKNQQWRDGDAKNNKKLLRIAYNDYLTKTHGITITRRERGDFR